MPVTGYVFFDAESGITSLLIPPMAKDQVIFLNLPAKTDGAVFSNKMEELVERIGPLLIYFRSSRKCSNSCFWPKSVQIHQIMAKVTSRKPL